MRMARSGTSVGTVIRWDDDRDGGLVESRDLPVECWVDASVVVHSTSGGSLRAGQVVEMDWVENEEEQPRYRAVRVSPRPDLQATVGG